MKILVHVGTKNGGRSLKQNNYNVGRKRRNYDICFVTANIPPDFSGAGKRAFNMARFMSQRGFKVLVLTRTKVIHESENFTIKSIKNLSVSQKNKSIFRYIVKKIYTPVFFVRVFLELITLNTKILHCFSIDSSLSLISIITSKITRKAKIILEVTQEGFDDPVSIKASKKRIIAPFFEQVDAIVNISPLLEEKCRMAQVDSSKIKLIPNSVDENVFSPPLGTEKYDLKRKLNIDFEYVLLHVGILRERKGVTDIIKVFGELSRKHDDIGLILAGETNKDEENAMYYQKLKKMVMDYGLNTKVVFTGNIEDVSEWMKAADIFVFASRKEGFGTVVIEAMSCGLPVVARKIEGITDFIIEHNNDGIIIDDNKGFVENIDRLLLDKKVWRQISKNARNKIVSSFSDEIVMTRYCDLYNDLIQKKHFGLR